MINHSSSFFEMFTLNSGKFITLHCYKGSYRYNKFLIKWNAIDHLHHAILTVKWIGIRIGVYMCDSQDWTTKLSLIPYRI